MWKNRRRCGLALGDPIPAPLRAAALLSFEGQKVEIFRGAFWSALASQETNTSHIKNTGLEVQMRCSSFWQNMP